MDKKEKGLLSVFAIILIVIIAAVIAVSISVGISRTAGNSTITQSVSESSQQGGQTSQTQGNTQEVTNQFSVNQAQITVDNAKNIALKEAGISDASTVVFTSEKLDYDNGRQVYEIEFHDAKTEYEYDIDSSTGEIVSRSQEPLDFD
ncbi:MAG: PepSY domain-containing protein [Eubacterium sp.]